MRRLTTIAAVLLSLTTVGAALAAGGLGKYQIKITGHGAKSEHGRLDGTWTVGFPTPGSGTVKLTWDGRPAGGGRYVISGSTITLTPKPGHSCTVTGKYRFKLSGGTLTFTKVSDPCADRRHILTYATWMKIG